MRESQMKHCQNCAHETWHETCKDGKNLHCTNCNACGAVSAAVARPFITWTNYEIESTIALLDSSGDDGSQTDGVIVALIAERETRLDMAGAYRALRAAS